jgi:hypothetical protein
MLQRGAQRLRIFAVSVPVLQRDHMCLRVHLLPIWVLYICTKLQHFFAIVNLHLSTLLSYEKIA